uniref:TAF6 C-terminal HEAT repeat domain-containing protein n=1 Tax=Ditylum brightwellii TaxID=49249 RepID=A0A7S4RRF6_9STRA
MYYLQSIIQLKMNSFGDQYTALKARVIKTLCEAMSPDKPLSTQYGGMAGLSLFGPKTVDAFILPLAKGNWEKWEKALESQGYNNSADFERRFEIQQCQHALLVSLLLQTCHFFHSYLAQHLFMFSPFLYDNACSIPLI